MNLGLVRGALLTVAVGLLPALGGCRVAESDVKRWETTQQGPCKLVAVITHDKYSLDLRGEAVLSLIRMPARGGVRQGKEFLVEHYKDCNDGTQREGALNQISDEQRRLIVDKITPELVKQLEPPPPARTPEGRLPPDPTIPYKDATFAMLVHEPPLVTNEATRQQLRAALIKWASTGFEDRVENGTQQFGLEQMMRFLGTESVKGLPAIINENTSRLDRVANLVNDVGDDAAKAETAKALVTLAQRYNSKDWIDAQTKVVKEYNAKNNTKADDSQVAAQVDKIQERRLTEEVFPSMKKIGGRSVVDYLFSYAADTKNPAERRKLALAALEGRIDKGNPQDLDRVYAIARNEDNPDIVRDVAFQRMGEFSKEQILPKLYALFEPKKWKTRWVAGEAVLKASTPKEIPNFLSRLPKTHLVKMGMTEGLSYGGKMKAMEPVPGEPKPRDILIPHYLGSKEFGARMTAMGFLWEGKKEDRGLVQPYENDATLLPKCEKEDECSWTCDVPKPGSKDEKEPKELKTVGEFVKFCLIPSMEH